MILPIVAYGDAVLRKKGEVIDKNYPDLKELIANMQETMHNASGVGLAAQQIGKAIRLFVIDATPFGEDEDLDELERIILKDFKRVFINAKIISEEGEEWAFNEGCLSIPDVRQDVYRKPIITIEYFDEDFNKKSEVLNGLAARVFQHEYDHIEGILFTDRISTLKKRLIKKKLEKISKGKIDTDYRMRFPKLK